MTPSLNIAYPFSHLKGEGGTILKAKHYERMDRPGNFLVQLYWKGVKYRRFHYDNDIGLVHEEMARQIASAINADIKKKGKAFHPRQWFKTKGYEFEFDEYTEK